MPTDADDWMGRDPYEEHLASLPECERCEGLGQLDNGYESIDCPDCGGTGHVDVDAAELETQLGVEARHDTDGHFFLMDDPFDDPDCCNSGGES